MLFKSSGKRTTNKSDEELISKFRSEGDLEILGDLYSRYIHLAYGVCLKYLKDRDGAQDAVMQIFEKLMIEIPRHKIKNFRSWLHVVSRNYCLMQLRSDRQEKEKMTEWLNEPSNFMEYASFLHPLDDEKKQGKIDKALEDCIERLKEEQKICIRQFYYENRSYNEIATIMDLNEKKVKSHLQNGKRNLKICLEEKNDWIK
jgi:RNA polymerase sigma-70 factor (ECF subfamily)